MEHKRNWLGWAALALGALALIVAFGGRFGPGGRMAMMSEMQSMPAAPVAPAAPSMPNSPAFERGERGERGGPMQRWNERGGHGAHGFADSNQGRMRDGAMMGAMHSHRGGMGMFALFGLLKMLGQVVALGMLAWLLVRLFNQRRNTPPTATAAGPDVPHTPAGHDPRVE